ncbi:MAG: TRAP transporter substrate-binding protein [Spirochaetales bacterium]|nr:TRAP transporter substrate-binding protein [Spirochaetales bacterium]
MKRIGVIILTMCLLTGFAFAGGQTESGTSQLIYAHMNAPGSNTGLQAVHFEELVKEKTNGSVIINVYPSSQLGTLQEMAEMVSNGSVAFHHNTMAGIGSLYADYAALDTPFLYKDVDHLMRVTDVDSPIMKKLNEGLIAERNVRNLYNFYFGTRQLTANKAVRTPDDLRGMKIRAIPFPIYMAAVDGMGAIATPIDFSELPTALATGAADGQENPANTIYANKFQDVQSHMMLTGHIMGAECVVVNETVWQSFTAEQQKQIKEAAAETALWATKITQEGEAENVQLLKDAGMTVISEAEGLDLEAFRSRVNAYVNEKFSDQYGEIYDIIKTID